MKRILATILAALTLLSVLTCCADPRNPSGAGDRTGDGTADTVGDISPTTAPLTTSPREPGVLSTSDFTMKVENEPHNARVSILESEHRTALRIEVFNDDGSTMCETLLDGPGVIEFVTADESMKSDLLRVFYITPYINEISNEMVVLAKYGSLTVHDGEIVSHFIVKNTGEIEYRSVDKLPYLFIGFEREADIDRQRDTFVNNLSNAVNTLLLEYETPLIADSLLIDPPYTSAPENATRTHDDLASPHALYSRVVDYYKEMFPDRWKS